MVKLYDFAKKTELRQHVLKNIEYTKNLTDDQLRTESNNRRLGLYGSNWDIYERLLKIEDPIGYALESFFDSHEWDDCEQTPEQSFLPDMKFLNKISNRSLTEQEYNGILEGKIYIVDCGGIFKWTIKD